MERNRTYLHTDKGRASRKRQQEREYLSRRFIAWDGEGDSLRYFLLACSTGRSVVDPEGLDSRRIWDFLLDVSEENPGAIHVIFGGGYDFNFWLRSLNRDKVETLWRNGYVDVKFPGVAGKYRLRWRPGRTFSVAHLGRSITIYDVLPFFQCSFVKACDLYLGNDWVMRDEIVRMKAERGGFEWSRLAEIQRYNDGELLNLVRLCVELRARLSKVGMRPKRWDGPGAVAAALLSSKGVKSALSRHNRRATPRGVGLAIRTAYAGGRFEPPKVGIVDTPAYEVDRRSAYPHALQFVPCLAHGKWVHVEGDGGEYEFALYRMWYVGNNRGRPGPLFRRSDTGAITYPDAVEGWYWTPEYRTAKRYVDVVGKQCTQFEVIETWIWQPDPAGCRSAGHSGRPFDWVPEYYQLRQELRAAEDGAHLAVKLGLNSLYGKLAQQVGWRITKDGKLRIPPFHELAWAGYVTSDCRAAVLNAVLGNLDDVIAFETDAVFTTVPLQSVQIGEGLGEWEITVFSNLAYAQSGFYFGTRSDGTVVERTRGVDRGYLHLESMVEAYRQERAEDRVMRAPLTRFIGAGLALQTGWEKWCTWETMQKAISAYPPEDSKRTHLDHCPTCEGTSSVGLSVGKWHETHVPYSSSDICSVPYTVEWEDADALSKTCMTVTQRRAVKAAEMRREGYEEWDGE